MVYGLSGVREVLHIARRCYSCNTRYYAIFKDVKTSDGGQIRILTVPTSEVTTWWVNPYTGVDMALLRQMHFRFFRAHASFGGEAAVRAMEDFGLTGDNAAEQRNLKANRLAWYQWRLSVAQENLVRTGRLQVAAPIILPPWEALETYIGTRWHMYAAMRQDVWGGHAAVHHGGVEQTVFVLDGHQRGTRARCGAEDCCALTSSSLDRSTVIDCPNSPARGSYYCPDHAFLRAPPLVQGELVSDVTRVVRKRHLRDGDEYLVHRAAVAEPVWVREFALERQVVDAYKVNGSKPTDIERVAKRRRVPAKAPEEYGLSCSTCKERGSHLFYGRTAGILLAAFPSGIVPHWCEMFESESRTQRYFFVAELLSFCPSLKVGVHDDGCHMQQFCRHRNRFQDDLAERGWLGVSSTPMRVLTAQLLWSLDRFHSVNHIDKWCHDNVNPALPHLKPYLAGVNTSVCESVFAWVRGFAGALHVMSRWLFIFFLAEMLDLHNWRLVSGDSGHLGSHVGCDLGRPPPPPPPPGAA